MSSSCFLRSYLRLRLFSLLRRSGPTTAAVHPFAPHRSARPHVPYAALRQRPILFRYYVCIVEVAAEPISVPFTVIHERRQRSILLRSMSSNANAEEAVMPRSMPVTVAHELLTAGHRYLDVRTVKEFSGWHAVGAVNIPYMLESVSVTIMTSSSSVKITKIPIFLESLFLQYLNHRSWSCSTFYIEAQVNRSGNGCLSGKRSLMAASELSNAGFTGITDVAGGFSAWVENGLPTDQKEPVRQSTCFL
ncbi:unnamed protein product [Musa acuminata var. zebrina]